MIGGKQTAEGLLKAVQAEYAEGTRPVTDAADRERWLTVSSESTNASTAASTLRTSRLRGVRRAHLIGWLFVAPALVMYAAFVLLPLALTVPVLALPLGRHRAVGMGRTAELRQRPHRP